MNIFLIGFMGSGKTSLGKQLASRLNRPFFDLDELIKTASGKSIPQIFEEDGEAFFRKLEMELLFKQHAGLQAVISLGGGAACNEKVWEWMNANGISIYLKTHEDILFGRLRQHKNERPLLMNKTDDELRVYIHELLEQRKPWYEKAHMIFEKENNRLSFLIKQLTSFLDF